MANIMMNFTKVLGVTLLLGLFSFLAQAKSFPSCECPQVSCVKGCEDQVDLKFYTEKCGDNGARVRSCAKPSCKAVEPYPAHCAMAKKKQASRQIASTISNKPKLQTEERQMAGTISELSGGGAWLKAPSGAREPLRIGTEVYELDTLITGKTAKLQMKFVNGNLMSMTPGSELKIQTMKTPSVNRKSGQTLLHLLKGKVRSKVQKKFKGSDQTTSHYKVKTRSAVAGVRGTDFVVSYQKGHKEITKVETVTGEVVLGSHDHEKTISVKESQYASFVAEPMSEDLQEFVSRGYLTPVYKLSKNDIQNIEREHIMGRKPKRAIASTKSDLLCKAPSGQYNQCSWKCENNPKSAKRCRTDLPNVNCVRRRCNANGEWKGDSRLPASFYDMCKPHKTRVDSCDY